MVKIRQTNSAAARTATAAPQSKNEMTLAQLPVGSTATIVKILPNTRGRKRLSDVGIVVGSEILMQAHAPFGGLLRVKVLETSMAIHSDSARNILLKRGKAS